MGIGLGFVLLCLLLLIFGGPRDRTEEKTAYKEAEDAIEELRKQDPPTRKPWGYYD
jgi:hypothetical protein